jgi:hypothetical protein
MSRKEATLAEVRLAEIAEDIAKIGPVVRRAKDELFANEMSLEQAESINRSAEVLVEMWTLEADLLRCAQRCVQARKQ